MRSRLRKLSLVLVFLLALQAFAPSALAAYQYQNQRTQGYQNQQSYQGYSGEQGEVLSGVGDAFESVKNRFLEVKGYLKDPKGNLAKWMMGKVFGEGLAEQLKDNGVIGIIKYLIFFEILGLPKETAWSGGGSAEPGSYLPPGAIPMPGGWYFSGGMIGSVNNAIAGVMSAPPASGVYYAYDVIRKIGISPAYAAEGFGFSSLRPILNLWKAFRNVAYAVMTLLFLVVGIMIMFRFRISPQTVLTIENALPRLIGVLILITFSYAIAGFLIDLMYVTMGLGVSVIASSVSKDILAELGKLVNFKGPVYYGSFYLVGAVLLGAIPMAVIISGIGGIIGAILGGILGLAVSGIGGAPGGVVLGAAGGVVLVGLIFLIIILFLLIKLFITLVKTYLSIIFLIIFSPFYLLGGILPGSALGFGSWLKQLTANLLVFPAIVFLVMIGHVIAFEGMSGVNKAIWLPPLLTPHGIIEKAVGWSWASSIISFGILLILPNIPKLIKGAFGIRDSGVGALAIAPVAATFGFLGGVGGRIASPYLGGAQAALSELAKDYSLVSVQQNLASGGVKGRVLRFLGVGKMWQAHQQLQQQKQQQQQRGAGGGARPGGGNVP